MRMARQTCLCLGLMLWLPAVVQGVEDLPDVEALEQRLQQLQSGESEAPSEAARRDIEALRGAIEGVERLAAVEERLQALKRRVQEAPDEMERLERELRGEEEEAPSTLSVTALDDMSLTALEQRHAEAVQERERLQDRLDDVETRLLNAQTLPERAQLGIADAMQRVERSRSAMEEIGAEVESDAPLPLQRRVEHRLAEQTLRLHQLELSSNARLRELAQRRRDLLTRQIDQQEDRVARLQSAVDRKRRMQSEQAVAEAALSGPLAAAAGHPVLRSAQQLNRDLSEELLRVTDRANIMAREGTEVRRQLEHVRHLQRNLNEQIDAIRGSLLLSRILREQYEALPAATPQRDLQEEIADLRLKQFELSRQRESLSQERRLAIQRLEEAGAEATPARVDGLLQLYQSRRELVDQLETAYGDLLTSAIELQLDLQQLFAITRELRTTIDEQLFWVANSRPLGLAWLRQLPSLLVAEWREGEWRRALPVHWRWPHPQALWGLPVLLMAVLLFGLRRRLYRRLVRLHQQVGRLQRDTQAHTPLAMAINALIASPGPLVVAAAGTVLVMGGEGMATAIGHLMWHLALAWGVIALARRLLVRDGVAVKHFQWPGGYAARLRWLLLWLGWGLVPVLLISMLARGADVNLASRPLALGILIAGLIALSVLLARLILAHTPFFGVKLFRLILGLVLSLVPLVMVGVIAMGYEFTALSLVGRFVATLYILGLWILAEAAVVRGLAVAARRLAYRRVLARRHAEVQEGAEGGLEVVEEPPLDMEQISQQSLRLSRLILLLGLILMLYLVWSDQLTVLGYLDRVAVLEGIDGEEGRQLSVFDVFTALLVFVLTLVTARNLPGLLEVSVLSRLELKQGSAYAITSLLSYTIIGAGVVVALATLGVTWDKLQWLVAALGVGLGFGLQEIFANFISGLIILFERPIRIGDTITLGELHGTVSRIRIRATTVTDFDRKEIIIPNKTFVTDQLINWSLSDSVTRVVLHYGVAYGSDLPLVHRLLRQAADENARVLRDPEPQVFFLSYGASTLDFELRIFVNSLVDRLHAADEINGRVDALFREHGVDIAFNQLEVRLHRRDGRARPGPASDESGEA